MSLPANFSGMPQEQLHHHFRNVCLEFKKTVKSTKEINVLDEQLERFINVCKHMNWPQKNTDVYRKNGIEKAANRVITEYRRYIQALQSDEHAINQDLLEAISEVEGYFHSLKAT